MKTALIVLGLLCLVAAAHAEIYFDEDFSNGRSRWVESTHKGGDAGSFSLSAGEYFGDAELDSGLRTNDNAKFYQISAALDKDFSNKDKTLVLQYSVKQEQNIDCGGAYVKLLPAGLDQESFRGDSEYSIMFGPDICGSDTRRVHVIFTYKGKNHLISKTIPCKTDTSNHVYTLIVRPDQTYEVLIDNDSVQKGNFDDWGFLPAKTIKDPSQSKPKDWVDVAKIADPEDIKPDGWDDIPATIADPEAEKPDDWDDELDGEWEAPSIANPDYKGPWSARMIANPAYKGPWVHPEIANPEYQLDPEIFFYPSHAFLGIEIWQVKAGSIFDNFLVTDDVELAHTRAADVVERAKQADEKRNDAQAAARRRHEEEEDEDHIHDELDIAEFME